ncbi:hypothetical protein [Geosporobacter ferrireducens]|uniref:Uncharacterized protein n=1 Tax=Geosporobacter ferrireducens TaxID=1424294 RepID=A0A1D8GM83_9FIRM|nr:hypothetical protein [Geosporobacter ferrireducens]AOT72026.1 hypothetical protein Gferi_22300 [Geosporobacter ferrireducens]MTI55906.1 hypothetical protein [Geosporobacter ferrireducens]
MEEKKYKILIHLVGLCVIVITSFAIINFESNKNSKFEPGSTKYVTDRQEITVNQPLVLKIAVSASRVDDIYMRLTNKFIPQVEKKSKWTIRVEVFESEKLGGDLTCIQGIEKGTIEMGLLKTSTDDADVTHVILGDTTLLINEGFWDSIQEEYKKIIMDEISKVIY